MQVRSISAEDLQQKAGEFVGHLLKESMATIITLSGELGAGKTTFAQGIARALGVEETVSSPTFVIEKVYQLQNQKWQRLIHIDAYRLAESHELEVLGWQELVEDSGNIIVLEWPERVPGIIPGSAHTLRFDIEGDTRIIEHNG